MSNDAGHDPLAQLSWLRAGIDAYIEKNRSSIIDDMRKLLTFETVSGGEAEAERTRRQGCIQEGFAWIGQRAQSLGLGFRNVENIVCVVEEPGEAGSIGVLLHLDVVPPGEGWTRPPFSGTLENGVIYGRGCQDDKGPVAQALHALAAVKSLGRPLRKSVRLILGSQEETGVWEDIERYLVLEAPPDLSIVPDAVFPIVSAEKGMVDIVFSAPPQAPETGALTIRLVRAGERANIVPHICEAVLEAKAEREIEAVRSALEGFLKAHGEARADFDTAQGSQTQSVRLVFHGRNAHGSTPEEGHNAARDAAAFLAGIATLAGPRAQFLRFVSTIAADDAGRALGIAMAHPFVGATTQNLGILSVGRSECRAVVNTRPTLGQAANDILNAARAKASEWAAAGLPITVEVQGKAYDPLYLNPERHPQFFEALKTAYSSATGREPTLIATPGTTFAKAFPNALCFGPVDPQDEEILAHKADERLHVDHLTRNVRIYGLALGLLALGN